MLHIIEIQILPVLLLDEDSDTIHLLIGIVFFHLQQVFFLIQQHPQEGDALLLLCFFDCLDIVADLEHAVRDEIAYFEPVPIDILGIGTYHILYLLIRQQIQIVRLDT